MRKNMHLGEAFKELVRDPHGYPALGLDDECKQHGQFFVGRNADWDYHREIAFNDATGRTTLSGWSSIDESWNRYTLNPQPHQFPDLIIDPSDEEGVAMIFPVRHRIDESGQSRPYLSQLQADTWEGVMSALYSHEHGDLKRLEIHVENSNLENGHVGADGALDGDNVRKFLAGRSKLKPLFARFGQGSNTVHPVEEPFMTDVPNMNVLPEERDDLLLQVSLFRYGVHFGAKGHFGLSHGGPFPRKLRSPEAIFQYLAKKFNRVGEK